MKKIIFTTLVLSLNCALAENSRSPAVLDGACNLDIPTTITVMVNGQEVVEDRVIDDVLKDQCAEIRKCMNSADEDSMEDLKNLESVACNNVLKPVSIKTPGQVTPDKNINASRQPKPNGATGVITKPATSPVSRR